MDISHIVSKKYLNLIDNRNFYMCLANIAIKDETYRNYYKKQVERGAFVLADNGAAEFSQCTLDDIWKVVDYIKPSEIVLSDTLCNGPDTLQKSYEAANFYMDKGYTGSFMGVPQGDTIETWMMTAATMYEWGMADTFGVSKFTTSHYEDVDARLKELTFLNRLAKNNNDRINVHLLGCHININEYKKILEADLPYINIRSTDTALAYIYTEAGEKIAEKDRPKNHIDFINGVSKNEDLLISNMKDFDDYVNHLTR